MQTVGYDGSQLFSFVGCAGAAGWDGEFDSDETDSSNVL